MRSKWLRFQVQCLPGVTLLDFFRFSCSKAPSADIAIIANFGYFVKNSKAFDGPRHEQWIPAQILPKMLSTLVFQKIIIRLQLQVFH